MLSMMSDQEKLLRVGRQLIFSCREICLGIAHKRASLLLISQSLELLLKSELASKQVTESRLKKEFGHNIKKMLAAAECSDLKSLMAQHADDWALDLERRGMERDPGVTKSRVEDFWDQIDLLADAHSPVSGYALRYPHDPIDVPIPVLPYLVVQSCIWDRLEALTGATILDEPLPAELRR